MAASRDPWLDNAKMALILLVVVGHTWALLPADGPGGRVYDFLYLWHMPAFIFISGYLSRAFEYAPERMWQLVRTLLVPYVLFEAALAVFRVHVGGEQIQDLFTDPHFPLWYLLALVVWRLLTPLFRPMWGGVVVAVAVCLAGGFVGGEPAKVMDVARILGFLPFFVLGLKATPERLGWLRGRFPAALGLAVLGVLWLLAGSLDRWAERTYLYYRPYELVDASDTEVVLTRLLLVVVGMAGALAFLALVPRWNGWFARMGSATLVVYLFHGFGVKGLEYVGFQPWAAERSWLGFLTATAVGAALALLLASPPVRRALQHVVDPWTSAQREVKDAVRLTAVAQEPDVEHEQAGERALAGR
ncbi:acyltransferase family protein [Nocardioides sp. SYSU DS0651]|uniref:acyltransferase family protein n=1 Tax=Nocardioides sp. SYSU DS0651 TaxID=3415955 RepID=UPI003F4AFA32